MTSPPGWSTPLPRTYQWRFVDFEPTPADLSGWWQAQSPYDVILGFTHDFTQRSPAPKWTWSSAATHGEPVSDNIQDGSLSTSWAEGVPGPGVGEWIQAEFKRPVKLRELRILPGHNEYPSAFRRYGRPEQLTAVFSDGSSVVLEFRDAPSLQRFPVDVTTTSVRLVVESVYLGSDYPATCIGEVEFGTREAPGYAPFARLIRDPGATGRLPSWAGPPAPAPRPSSGVVDWFAEGDAEWAACGDLIGVDRYTAFPADEAAFKEPVALDDLAEVVKGVPLPDEELVGEPTEVSALSYLTYEIHYDSGIDLLVNTRVSGVPNKSVIAELADEAEYMETYEDGRGLPYEVLTIGDAVVGVARPGTIVSDCSSGSDEGDWDLPGQVFWRDEDTSYHLYARSDEVATDELVQIATSLIDPKLLEKTAAADSGADEPDGARLAGRLARSASPPPRSCWSRVGARPPPVRRTDTDRPGQADLRVTRPAPRVGWSPNARRVRDSRPGRASFTDARRAPCSTTSASGPRTSSRASRSSSRRSRRSASRSAWRATAASGWAARASRRCGSRRATTSRRRCTSPSPRRTARRSTSSTPRRWRPAARTTALPACVPTTTPTTTRPSSSGPTGATSRPSATA